MGDGPFVQASAVGIGAAVGAVARFFIGLWLKPFSADFPWHTLLINLLGSFLIGIAAVGLLNGKAPQVWTSLLVVGVLGGFTTFSSFSIENLQLIQKGRIDLCLLYGLGSCVAGIVLAWMGTLLANSIFTVRS